MSSGFIAKVRNYTMDGLDSTGHTNPQGDYVYMVPTAWTGSSCVFTIEYRIDGGSWKIVAKGQKNNEKGTGSILDLDAVKNNKELYKQCLFSVHEPTMGVTFDNVTSSTNLTIPNQSGTSESKAYIYTGKYGDLSGLNDDIPGRKVYTSQGDDWTNAICVRIDAKALGWKDIGNNKKVDINITFIDPESLNRSFTVPITYINDEIIVTP